MANISATDTKFASAFIFLQASGINPIGTEHDWINFIYAHLEAGTFCQEVLERWLHEHTEPFEV